MIALFLLSSQHCLLEAEKFLIVSLFLMEMLPFPTKTLLEHKLSYLINVAH